jgi:hypothetical protein
LSTRAYDRDERIQIQKESAIGMIAIVRGGIGPVQGSSQAMSFGIFGHRLEDDCGIWRSVGRMDNLIMEEFQRLEWTESLIDVMWDVMLYVYVYEWCVQ